MMVSLSYELLDEEGELVEGSEPWAPLTFLFGYGQVAPGVERGVDGLFEGDSRQLALAPEHAFGRRDPEAVLEVDLSELPAGAREGDEFEAEASDGSLISLVVLELTPDRAVLDANHPLAGQTVELRVTVDAVRPATRAEIDAATERLNSAAEGAMHVVPLARLTERGRNSHDREESDS